MATKHEYRVGKDILVIDSTGAMTPVGVTNSGLVIANTTETIAAGGTTTALDVTKFRHNIDADAGGDIFTLAAGTQGQMVYINCLSATGVATITPVVLHGGTSITMNAVGESVQLYYDATNGWEIMGGNDYTVI